MQQHDARNVTNRPKTIVAVIESDAGRMDLMQQTWTPQPSRERPNRLVLRDDLEAALQPAAV